MKNKRKQQEPESIDERKTWVDGVLASIRSDQRRRVEDAVAKLSQELQEDYRKAQQKAPALIRLESDPVLFLQLEDDNEEHAARRLCAYWTNRQVLFGKRALLPLNLSGQGALTEEEVAFVREGHINFSPEKDARGRTLLVYDSRRVTIDPVSRFRSLFYMLSIAAEDGSPLVVFRVSDEPQWNVQRASAVMTTIASAPVRLDGYYYVFQSPSGEKQLVQQHIQPLFTDFVGREDLESIADVCITDSMEELSSWVADRGMPAAALPNCLGGEWDSTDLSHWLDQRLAKEYTSTNEQPWMDSADRIRCLPGASNVPECATEPTSPELMVKCEQVRAAVNKLKAKKKAAYLEAVERCPLLVDEESDPSLFLHAEDGNVERAAGRLAAYWTKRKDLFGDRALLPLDISGKNAMSPDDIAVLRLGHLSFLPNSNGRIVVFYDHHKHGVPSLGERFSRFRCNFYLMSIAAQAKRPIVLVRYSDSPHFSEERADETMRISSALPLRMELFLALFVPPAGSRRVFENTAVPLFTHFMTKYVSPQRLKCFIGDSPEVLLHELQELGFTRDGIPEKLGGLWPATTYATWLRYRMVAEMVVARESSQSSASTDDDPQQRRKADALYAKERRMCDKEKEEMLRQSYLLVNEENQELVQEEKRLKGLLDQASKIISAMGCHEKAEPSRGIPERGSIAGLPAAASALSFLPRPTTGSSTRESDLLLRSLHPFSRDLQGVGMMDTLARANFLISGGSHADTRAYLWAMSGKSSIPNTLGLLQGSLEDRSGENPAGSK